MLQHGANVNKEDNLGQTSLHIASYHGHDAVVALLLQHGADANKANKDRYTHRYGPPQYYYPAPRYSNLNNDGETPLCIAATGGHDAIVSLLLQHNADVNKTSN